MGNMEKKPRFRRHCSSARFLVVPAQVRERAGERFACIWRQVREAVRPELSRQPVGALNGGRSFLHRLGSVALARGVGIAVDRVGVAGSGHDVFGEGKTL